MIRAANVRPCPPELARRAVAFDRVLEALQAMGSLATEDLELVGTRGGNYEALCWLRAEARLAHAELMGPAAELTWELESLDE